MGFDDEYNKKTHINGFTGDWGLFVSLPHWKIVARFITLISVLYPISCKGVKIPLEIVQDQQTSKIQRSYQSREKFWYEKDEQRTTSVFCIPVTLGQDKRYEKMKQH